MKPKRTINVALMLLRKEDHYFNEVCPNCYHELDVEQEENGDIYLICPNQWCIDETHYEPLGYVSPWRYKR